MRCNCESAYCYEHGGDVEKRTCDPCPNEADGRFLMDMVGPVCERCADRAIQTGAEKSIFEQEVPRSIVELKAGEVKMFFSTLSRDQVVKLVNECDERLVKIPRWRAAEGHDRVTTRPDNVVGVRENR